MERKLLKHSLRYCCLTKVVGKEKEMTRKEKGKEMHPLEVEAAQLYCSLASDLPREEQSTHYRAVMTLFCCERRVSVSGACLWAMEEVPGCNV